MWCLGGGEDDESRCVSFHKYSSIELKITFWCMVRLSCVPLIIRCTLYIHLGVVSEDSNVVKRDWWILRLSLNLLLYELISEPYFLRPFFLFQICWSSDVPNIANLDFYLVHTHIFLNWLSSNNFTFTNGWALLRWWWRWRRRRWHYCYCTIYITFVFNVWMQFFDCILLLNRYSRQNRFWRGCLACFNWWWWSLLN